MTSRILLFLLLLVALTLSAGNASADPARLVIYLLDQGKPMPGVSITVDGEVRGTTDANGAERIRVEPGVHGIQLADGRTVHLERRFEAGDGEFAQWIVSLRPDGPPLVSVESSLADSPGAVAGDAGESGDEVGKPGFVEGRVVSAEDGGPVSGAVIYISGSPIQVETGEQGRFRVELSPGEYAVSITHPDFATRTVDDVSVTSRQATPLEIEVTPAVLELAEFVVVEPHVEGSLTSMLAERRQSAAVTDVLSAEQISRAGDSDAAGALKRVTGLTLVDGEFIYVRGLGERYSSVLLNGAAIPSPDPTRRVVPLDLFPADVIESVVVQKTAAASMPGDFGGGTVQLRTVGFPDSLKASLSVSSGYNQLATLESGLRDEGGGRDWTGFDDGTRDLPESLRQAISDGAVLRPRSLTNPEGLTPGELETLGEDLATRSNYNVFEDDLAPDVGVNGVLGNSFQLGEDSRWGFLGAVQYDQEWTNVTEERRTFAFSDAGLQQKDDFDLSRTRRNVDLSGFFNLGLEIGQDHKLGMNSMLLRQTEDEVRIAEGEVDSQSLQRVDIEWVENQLFSNQFTGTHEFPLLDWGTKVSLDWQYTDATASRMEPNTRRYRRDDDNDDGIFQFSTRADSNSQVFGDLDDDLADWSVSAGFTFGLGPHMDGRFGFGAGSLERDRTAELRTFAFGGRARFGQDVLLLPQDEVLVPDRINPGSLTLSESTRADDNYTATQALDSRFYNLDLTLFEDWRLTAGLRTEENLQEVATFDLANPDEAIVGTLDRTTRLPSGSLTWSYSENAQLRFGYAETVNRPDFRELSESPYRDPVLDTITVGNPELKTASINNYDVRWEYYFSPTDSISVAGFYKEFSDPIEKTFQPGGSRQIITLQNSIGAETQGVEFDIYRTFGFLQDVDWLEGRSEGPVGPIDWSNYYVSANYTRLQSNVRIDTTRTTQTNADRPLQGASPWVANFQLGYTSPESGHEWTLLYNEFGERISRAGIQGQPDIYEQPFSQLDFVYRYRFADHWRFSLKLDNLLDSEVKFTQGDRTTRQYRKGREISLGLQWSY